MKKIAVTGGAGYVGSALVPYLPPAGTRSRSSIVLYGEKSWTASLREGAGGIRARRCWRGRSAGWTPSSTWLCCRMIPASSWIRAG